MPFQFRKEAIEEDLNTNFPSQGQGNPPLYYSLSEVVVPTYSINSTAEGSGLPQNLQTAWDFGTGAATSTSGTSTIINTPGFWQIDLTCTMRVTDTGVRQDCAIELYDGVTAKVVWAVSTLQDTIDRGGVSDGAFVVYVRTGDIVRTRHSAAGYQRLDVWYRQIADINARLINPLGFSFA